MAKFSKVEGPGERYCFYCPGCRSHHFICTAPWQMHNPQGHLVPGPVWKWNGNAERPTLQPSLRCRESWADGEHVCHLYLTDGVIEFLNDSTHDLRGKKVPLEDLDAKP